MSKVLSVEKFVQEQEVFDVGVEANHNYYVMAPGSEEATLVHNCHYAPALATSRVLSRFNTAYRLGLTATPAKKLEGLIQVLFDLIGPVIYRASVEQLRPTVDLVVTGLKFELKHGNFTSFVSSLEYATKRQDMIVEAAINAIKQGHMVLIPMIRVRSVEKIVKKINDKMGSRVAAGFHGAVPKDIRTKLIANAREYKIKVLVGNTRLLSTGLNIPRASCLIEATLSSNLPNAEQRTARILTPMEGKPTPLIIYFLDDADIMRRTRQKEWWGVIYRKFNPHMPPRVKEAFQLWMAGKDTTYQAGKMAF